VHGTNCDSRLYELLQKRIVKIVYTGMIHSSIKHIQDANLVIVMIRPCRNQAKSFHHMRLRHIRHTFDTTVKSGATHEEFLHDVTELAGINFACCYMNLLTDAITRGYTKSLLFVDYDSLKTMMLPRGIQLDRSCVVDTPNKEDIEFKELAPGFF
jgi:hypothetical protein